MAREQIRGMADWSSINAGGGTMLVTTTCIRCNAQVSQTVEVGTKRVSMWCDGCNSSITQHIG